MRAFGARLEDGRELEIWEIRPPANFAELKRGETHQKGPFTFSGFRGPGGMRLLRISEDRKEPIWVRIDLVAMQPPMVFTWGFGGAATSYTTTQRAG